jgi:NADPH-dependent 2,4-dienoyl-CoA reductase/sulfur reductase-like enzyme
LQQLVYLAGRKPFARAVIVGTELVSFSALLTLRHAGSRAVAMLETGPRIVARRPGDLIARTIFGVPVLTRTRLVAILGERLVEGVEVETDGRRQRLACDGVVFTGAFVPETALLVPSHLGLDAGTGGPLIDQAWRCTDPAYFAAGNLLHPIETAQTCWAEGRAAAEALAASLDGAVPANRPAVPVTYAGPIRYLYPQRIVPDGGPLSPLLLRLRVSRPARGTLRLLVNGGERWSHRGAWLPERRIVLPAERVDPRRLESLHIVLDET